MFNDTGINILNPTNLAMVIKTINGNVQPYTKNISYEDGYELEITKRAFCDQDVQLDVTTYIRIEGQIYKIIELKEWSDYVELYLYLCKPNIV